MCDLAQTKHTDGKSNTKFIQRGSHKGKGLAVFTSGGDSQVNLV